MRERGVASQVCEKVKASGLAGSFVAKLSADMQFAQLKEMFGTAASVRLFEEMNKLKEEAEKAKQGLFVCLC